MFLAQVSACEEKQNIRQAHLPAFGGCQGEVVAGPPQALLDASIDQGHLRLCAVSDAGHCERTA